MFWTKALNLSEYWISGSNYNVYLTREMSTKVLLSWNLSVFTGYKWANFVQVYSFPVFEILNDISTSTKIDSCLQSISFLASVLVIATMEALTAVLSWCHIKVICFYLLQSKQIQ